MEFGSHVSIRNGYLGAAKQAERLGGRSFQYFPKNPRSLSIKAFNRTDAEACAAYCRERGLRSIAHSAYPANLAAEGEKRKAVIESLRNDLDITEACGSVGLVVHFGIYKGPELLEGYQHIVLALNEILRDWQGESLLLLENQAGEHARMGMTFEELTSVRKLTDYPDKIGFVLDTCHLFASGIWNGTNWDEVAARGEDLGYFEHLKAIHMNDSVYPSGAYRDRHARIGQGYIGEDGFRQLLASSVVQGLPAVLETPDSEFHADEIAYLNRLAE